nr:MAG TPA: hypothetical protein [Caudoviricetes sp.]
MGMHDWKINFSALSKQPLNQGAVARIEEI